MIRSLHRDTADTFTIALHPAGDPRPFHFAPGQFNMLYVFGVGEVPISICGDPANRDELVHTVRAVGPVTQAMARLRPGDVLGVRGPYGSAWPVEDARGRDVVVIAGGLGLPPLRPAVDYLLAHREEYGRIALLYGARTPRDILYPRQLERWRGRLDLEVNVTVDIAPPAWRGNVGLVTTLIPRARFDPLDAICLIVGPEIMMRFTVLALEQQGVPEENIYVSMERNMKCAVGLCGHCQFGPEFVCKDGAVFPLGRIAHLLQRREV